MEETLAKLVLKAESSGSGGSSSVEREPWYISEDEVERNEYAPLGGVVHVTKGMMKGLGEVACKKMALKDQSSLDNFRREMSHATHLIHANLLHPIGGWYKFDPGSSCGTGYIIMELLFPLKTEEIFQLDAKLRLKHTSEVADGLAYMHSNGFTHRDIKPDNIMKDAKGRTKLIDFGLAKKNVMDNANRTRLTGAGEGTLAFMAPEIIESGEGGGNSKVDVYAFAMVIYEWWTNYRAWGSFTSSVVRPDHEIVKAVKRGDRPELPKIQYAYEMNFLVRECWAQDMDLRPKMEDVSLRLKMVLSGLSTSVEKNSKAVEKEQEQDKLHKLMDELGNELAAEKAKVITSQDVSKMQGLKGKIEALKHIDKQKVEVEVKYQAALKADDFEAGRLLQEQLKALGLEVELILATPASSFNEFIRLGFSSIVDYDEFKRLGFTTKGDYEDFKREGFSKKNDYDEFKLLRFTTKGDYEDFKREGFSKKDFNKKADYDECKRLGFKSKADYDEFKSLGFTSKTAWLSRPKPNAKADYDECKRLGFSSKANYKDCKRLGFTSKTDYDECKRLGFTSKTDFDECKRMGYASKADYDNFMQVLCFPRSFVVSFFNHHFHVALADAEESRRATGEKGDRVGAAPSPLPSLSVLLTCGGSSPLLFFFLTLSSSPFWMFARGLPFASVFHFCNRAKAKTSFFTMKLER